MAKLVEKGEKAVGISQEWAVLEYLKTFPRSDLPCHIARLIHSSVVMEKGMFLKSPLAKNSKIWSYIRLCRSTNIENGVWSLSQSQI